MACSSWSLRFTKYGDSELSGQRGVIIWADRSKNVHFQAQDTG